MHPLLLHSTVCCQSNGNSFGVKPPPTFAALGGRGIHHSLQVVVPGAAAPTKGGDN